MVHCSAPVNAVVVGDVVPVVVTVVVGVDVRVVVGVVLVVAVVVGVVDVVGVVLGVEVAEVVGVDDSEVVGVLVSVVVRVEVSVVVVVGDVVAVVVAVVVGVLRRQALKEPSSRDSRACQQQHEAPRAHACMLESEQRTCTIAMKAMHASRHNPLGFHLQPCVLSGPSCLDPGDGTGGWPHTPTKAHVECGWIHARPLRGAHAVPTAAAAKGRARSAHLVNGADHGGAALVLDEVAEHGAAQVNLDVRVVVLG